MMQFDKVSYVYPLGQEALKNVSFDLDQGQCIGLIGPSGAGKSTIFKLLMGIERPSTGLVKYQGVPLQYRRKALVDHFRRVGLIFQNPDDQLLSPLVFDEVAFGYKNLGRDLHKLEHVVTMTLERVQLSGFEKRYVQGLSYGEKKRLALASMLVMDQPLLLLDEPTAGLDPRATQEMVKLVKDLNHQGIRLLIASHDLTFVQAVCDYLLVVNSGHLVYEGALRGINLEEGLWNSAYWD